jgi:simple sugar transport system ATP-binding protein
VDNLLLTSYSRYCKGGLFNKEPLKKGLEGLLSRFGVVAPKIDVMARQLSGGNLQKLILARELSKDPRLLIAEQPTHGLDIGATEEIWKELIKQRESAGVLLISGDLREVLSLSDRIGVIFRGRLMDILSAEDVNRIGEIGPMMAGVKKGREDEGSL